MELASSFPFPWQLAAWRQLDEARRRGRLAHALLLSGQEDIGKSLFAEELARALLCAEPGDDGRACGHCRACRLLAAGSHPDLHRLSPEEGSRQIRIEAVRKLREESTLVVGEAKRRIFLLDPADALGGPAANALLKTLEEPLAGIHLLLVSSRPESLPITIRSRCQQVRFPQPPAREAAAWLARQGEMEPDAARQLLGIANGAPMQALAMANTGADREYRQMAREFIELAQGKQDPVEIAEQWSQRVELRLSLNYLASWLQLLLRQQMSNLGIDNPALEILQTHQARLDLRTVFRLLDNLFEIQRDLNHNLNPQLVLEELLLEWYGIARGAY